MNFKATLTQQGLHKLLAFGVGGQSCGGLTHIAFGEGKYFAEATQVALRSEVARKPLQSVRILEDLSVHIHCVLEDDSSFEVSEIGVFFEDGILFALWANESPVFVKTATENIQLILKMTLSDETLQTAHAMSSGSDDNLRELIRALENANEQIRTTHEVSKQTYGE